VSKATQVPSPDAHSSGPGSPDPSAKGGGVGSLVRTGIRIVVGAAATGGLLALSMPPGRGGFLAWAALAPLLIAAAGTRFSVGFLGGVAAGLAAAGLSSAGWLYGGAPEPGRETGWIVIGFSVIGTTVGIVCGVWAELRGVRASHVALLAGAAVLLELLSLQILPVHLGLTQHEAPAWLLAASATGIWGVSFAAWLSNLFLAALALRGRQTAASLTFVVLAGSSIMSWPREEGTLLVAALQCDSDDGRSLRELTSRAGAQGARLVVWPELSGNAFAAGGYDGGLAELSLTDELPAFVTSFTDGTRPLPHNTARLYHRGAGSAPYRKRRLFGGERSQHAPGDRAVAVPWRGGALGLNICFDSCFPALMRETARLPGVSLIALPAMGPDSVHGVVAAAHSAYTAFRAAELGVPIVSAELASHAAIFDRNGRAVARATGRGGQVVSGGVAGEGNWTLYKAAGDWFLYGIALLSLALSVVRLRAQPPKKASNHTQP